MPINPNLLIAAPMLQDYLVDDVTGQPLAAGTITMYQDNSRTTYKNWYYQTGTPGNYTYVTLPNPLTLSGVGTITDDNGNDTIPFYYPYSEVDNLTPQPYYVVVTNADGQQQFTRQNFPFLPQSGAPANSVPTQNNLIINGEFWRNVGSINLTNVTQGVLAPSQHDGFSMPDIQFIKNVTGATDTLTFTKFAAGVSPLMNTITPEYYINFNCSAVQAGETLKCVQIPISLHIKTLENVAATVVIWAQNVSGSSNNQLTLTLNQFLGTGVSSPTLAPIQTIMLNSAWTMYAFEFVFPSSVGQVLGAGGDDAFYLQIGFPLSLTCNINFAKPSIYLSGINQLPTNDFQTYDQIDAVINSSRTGDVRQSINYANTSVPNANFLPNGWIPLNNGTIGNASSHATTRANSDTWQLYSLIWNSISDIYCPVVTALGVPNGRGASAYADFTANNQIYLPTTSGRALANTLALNTASAVKFFNSTNVAINPVNTITLNDTSGFYTGSAIAFGVIGASTLPAPFLAGTSYFVIIVNSTTIQLATSVANAVNNIAIAITTTGSGNFEIGLGTGVHNLGSYLGQETHAQTLSELAAHSHPPVSGSGFRVQVASGGTEDANAGTLNAIQSTTGNSGGNAPFNVLQPTIYVNFIIKL